MKGSATPLCVIVGNVAAYAIGTTGGPEQALSDGVGDLQPQYLHVRALPNRAIVSNVVDRPVARVDTRRYYELHSEAYLLNSGRLVRSEMIGTDIAPNPSRSGIILSLKGEL